MIGALIFGGIVAIGLGVIKALMDFGGDKKLPPPIETSGSKSPEDQDDKCVALKDAISKASYAEQLAYIALRATEKKANWQLAYAIVASVLAGLATAAAILEGWTPMGAAALAAALIAGKEAAEAWTKFIILQTRVDQAKRAVAEKVRQSAEALKKFKAAGCDKKTPAKPKTDRKQPKGDGDGDGDKKPGEQGRP